MAEIDHLKLAAAVVDALEQAGLSYAGAVERHPELDRSMLSRACNGKPLSAANHLLVCQTLGLDPFAFLIRQLQTRTTLREILQRNQPVAVGDARETPFASREGGASPLRSGGASEKSDGGRSPAGEAAR